MVIKVYQSTLTGKTFKKKKDAQKHEDSFIAEYIKYIDKRAEKAKKYINKLMNI